MIQRKRNDYIKSLNKIILVLHKHHQLHTNNINAFISVYRDP